MNNSNDINKDYNLEDNFNEKINDIYNTERKEMININTHIKYNY